MHAFRRAFFVVATVTSLAVSGSATAQDQLINKDQEDQFAKVAFQFREKVMAGAAPSTPAELELASRYFVLRVTYLQAQVDPNTMLKYLKDFEVMVNVAAANYKNPNNRDIVGKFAPHLINRFKEVFALNFLPNRVAVVNAAVMLPQLARLKNDDIGDYLAAVVADEKLNDLIRMHAAKGLREYFPARAFTKLDMGQGKQLLDRKDREVKRVNALLKYIDRPMPKANNAEEVDALRYMRTEAVAALAQTGVPAVTSLGGVVEGPVAVGLLKVLAKKVQPEPSIRERVEAANGVCYFSQLRFAEEYDPKIGVYLVGACLSDFFSEYKKDFANITLKAKDKERKPTYLAWRHESKRFEVALAELVSNTRGTPGANAAQTLETMAKPILSMIYNHQALEREQEFRTAVEKLKPNTKVLFKSKGKGLELDWDTAGAAEEK